MRKILKVIFLMISISLLSCSKKKSINWNPHTPNYGITNEDALENGFNLKFIDHGCCMYSKKKNNKELYLTFDDSDDCEKISSQQLYIKLKEKLITDLITDRKELIEILKEYSCTINSEFENKGKGRTIFKTTNFENKELIWEILVDENDLFLVSNIHFN